MEIEARIQRSIGYDLADSSGFDRYFEFHHSLGSGSDGQVSAYTHRSSNRTIAVKIPRTGRYEASEVIRKEAKALKEIGKYGIPELMVWKLFKDMVLALDFLHNKCGFIHRDVKSENILVVHSPTDHGSVIPKVPVFKLCDFPRVVPYPSTAGKIHRWAGTVDYAPPPTERQEDEPARPAGDMWSLGATLQDFALGINPIQSRKAFVDQMNKWEEPHPKLIGEEELWRLPMWRTKFPAAYRPLNLEASVLLNCCDFHTPLSRSYKPFSDELNKWCKKLGVVDPDLRATSASLAKELVSIVDVCIGDGETTEQHRTDSLLVTPSMKHQQPPACDSVGRIVVDLRKPQGPDQAPSYEGNDYPMFSSEYMCLGDRC